MAEFDVDHAATDHYADLLENAGEAMETAMEECLDAVQRASEPLSGQLHTATLRFYDVLRQADGQMSRDIAAAADVVRHMHGAVTYGDKSGAAVVQLHMS